VWLACGSRGAEDRTACLQGHPAAAALNVDTSLREPDLTAALQGIRSRLLAHGRGAPRAEATKRLSGVL
jgi:hypothetical protein